MAAGAEASRREPVRPAPERQDVAPALVLFGATVLSSVAFKTGPLRLIFSTGAHLAVVVRRGGTVTVTLGPTANTTWPTAPADPSRVH